MEKQTRPFLLLFLTSFCSKDAFAASDCPSTSACYQKSKQLMDSFRLHQRQTTKCVNLRRHKRRHPCSVTRRTLSSQRVITSCPLLLRPEMTAVALPGSCRETRPPEVIAEGTRMHFIRSNHFYILTIFNSSHLLKSRLLICKHNQFSKVQSKELQDKRYNFPWVSCFL